MGRRRASRSSPWPPSDAVRLVAELAVGVVYVVGAGFNTIYTLRHSRQFYGEFATGAWLSSAGSFIRHWIIPNGAVFTVGLIAFQIAIAAAILTRGATVGPALLLGGLFALVVAMFSSPGGTIGNLALAAIQFVLAATR